jgi:hypothetical protein
MRAMNKERIKSVLERQRISGISISDFCRNEGYPISFFYYWRRKFGLSEPGKVQVSADPAFCLAPVSIAPKGKNLSIGNGSTDVFDRIELELPGGVRIYFQGHGHSQSALEFITQIYRSHVLP